MNQWPDYQAAKLWQKSIDLLTISFPGIIVDPVVYTCVCREAARLQLLAKGYRVVPSDLQGQYVVEKLISGTWTEVEQWDKSNYDWVLVECLTRLL